jgi:DNA sulfur modification protein DndB
MKSDTEWSWSSYSAALNTINWKRDNVSLWEGRALNAGRVSKANQNITLTSNVVKKALGLELSADETRLENSLQGARS